MCLIDCWAEIKICRNTSLLVKPSSQSVEPSIFRILEPTASFFLYSDLQHLEYCLINPIDSKIYIQASLCSQFANFSKLLEPIFLSLVCVCLFLKRKKEKNLTPSIITKISLCHFYYDTSHFYHIPPTNNIIFY